MTQYRRRRVGALIGVSSLAVTGAVAVAGAAGAATPSHAKPAVTAVSPVTGSAAGGTVVKVSGSGFTKLTKVDFGTRAGTKLTVLSSKSLTVRTPAHAAGMVDVRVIGSYGTSAITGQDRYTFTPVALPPAVTGLTAAAGTSGLTDFVTLSWTNPAGYGFTGVTIRRAVGATAPSSPTSGTAVAAVAASAHSYTDTGLSASTTYSYAVFAHYKTGYSAAAKATASTASCTNLPEISVSGTITTNMTWTPACTNVYNLQGTVKVAAGVTLTLAPGTVVKSLGGGLDVAGSLVSQGTSSTPVVFSSTNDNMVGRVTGSGNPTSGDWDGITIENATGSTTIADTVIRYATTAITVNKLTKLSVTGSEFAYEGASFAVLATTDQNPQWAKLPCTPPYLAQINAAGDWFGVVGVPGASLDTADYVGLTVPAPFTSLYSSVSSDIAAVAPPDRYADDTVPWSMYSCTTPTSVSFPVTPVAFTPLASSAPYRSLAEEPTGGHPSAAPTS